MISTTRFPWYDESRDRRVDLLVEYEISREHDGVRPDWECCTILGATATLLKWPCGFEMTPEWPPDFPAQLLKGEFLAALESNDLLRDDVEAACWAANSAADAVGRDRRNEARAERLYGRY